MIPSENDRAYKIEMEPEFDVIHHRLSDLPFLDLQLPKR